MINIKLIEEFVQYGHIYLIQNELPSALRFSASELPFVMGVVSLEFFLELFADPLTWGYKKK